jgi:hypothetical protein
MITVDREHLTANEFREALFATPPGGTIVYFTGELGYDLHMASLAKDPGAAELRLVVKMAIEGSDAGDLALTQKRIARAMPAVAATDTTPATPATPGAFEYRATKVRPKFRSARRSVKSAREIGEAA